MQGNHPKLGNRMQICIHFDPNPIDRKVDHRELWEIARVTMTIADRDYLCAFWRGEKPARPSGSVYPRKFWTFDELQTAKNANSRSPDYYREVNPSRHETLGHFDSVTLQWENLTGRDWRKWNWKMRFISDRISNRYNGGILNVRFTPPHDDNNGRFRIKRWASSLSIQLKWE
jgi:hypothetical protein